MSTDEVPTRIRSALGSSFGGFAATAYAAMFPDHPAGVILTNTTGGRTDHVRSIDVFRRIGGGEAATIARQDFEQLTKESAEEFNRVFQALFSAKPGYFEETRRRLALSVRTTEVNLYCWRNEAEHAETFVRELSNAAKVELLRLPGARQAVFRDAPELTFPAVVRFLTEYANHSGASPN